MAIETGVRDDESVVPLGMVGPGLCCDDHEPPWIDRSAPRLLPHADVPPPPPHRPADHVRDDAPF